MNPYNLIHYTNEEKDAFEDWENGDFQTIIFISYTNLLLNESERKVGL